MFISFTVWDILNASDLQEMNMERVRLAQKANLAAAELAQLIIALLDQLLVDCRYVYFIYLSLVISLNITCLKISLNIKWQDNMAKIEPTKHRLKTTKSQYISTLEGYPSTTLGKRNKTSNHTRQ